jgi:hypothetical protein
MRKVVCSNCEAPLNIDGADLLATPPPCQECGSERYTVKLEIHEQVSIHEHVKGKVKDEAFPSRKKVRAEFITGEEERKSDGQWVKKDRYWNKDKNIYSETVIDPKTGEVIHSCEEPFTEHVGHGAAKFGMKE